MTQTSGRKNAFNPSGLKASHAGRKCLVVAVEVQYEAGLRAEVAHIVAVVQLEGGVFGGDQQKTDAARDRNLQSQAAVCRGLPLDEWRVSCGRVSRKRKAGGAAFGIDIRRCPLTQQGNVECQLRAG